MDSILPMPATTAGSDPLRSRFVLVQAICHARYSIDFQRVEPSSIGRIKNEVFRVRTAGISIGSASESSR